MTLLCISEVESEVGICLSLTAISRCCSPLSLTERHASEILQVSCSRPLPYCRMQNITKKCVTRIRWFPSGCAHVCVCVCQSLSHVRLFATPCSLPGSSVHGNSPGKNTGVGCHSFLQGIFPNQELNPGLHYSQVYMKDCITGSLYCLSQ